MTPAQLHVLITEHNRANDPKGRHAADRDDLADPADLLALARMRIG